MNYDFDWDPKKAKSNIRKHGIRFEVAATVFRDPKALTVPDEEHSEKDERWITVGVSKNTNTLVVIHTYIEIEKDSVAIRIISARKATEREKRNYLEGSE